MVVEISRETLYLMTTRQYVNQRRAENRHLGQARL